MRGAMILNPSGTPMDASNPGSRISRPNPIQQVPKPLDVAENMK
jgi:hypothetical protein